MTRSINLSLTDELCSFLHENSGDGTLFSTPSELVRDLIRHKKDRQDADFLRKSILEGYRDIKGGCTHEYSGNLRAMLKAHQNHQSRA